MSLQIKGKFIQLEAGEALKQKKADGSVVELIKVDESITEGSQVRVAGEQVARASEVAALDARLDKLEGPDTLEGSVAKALKDAKDYVNDVIGVSSTAVAAFASLAAQMTDGDSATGVISALGSLETRVDSAELAITDLQSDLSAEITRATTAEQGLTTAIATASSAAADAVAAEETRAMTAEAGLAADIAAEVAARQAQDTALSTSLQALVQAEANSRTSEDNAIKARLDKLEGADTVVGSVAKAEKDAKAYADAAVLVEKTRAEEQEGLLADRLTIIQGPETQAGSIAKALKDAKEYADNLVAQKDQASEISFAPTAGVPETTVQGAIEGLDGRVTTLEARAHYKEKFVLSATDVSNGYVTLAHVPMSNSVVASVGRLMIHQDEDFDFSMPGEPANMKFINSLVTPGQEKLAAGDVIFVKYMA